MNKLNLNAVSYYCLNNDNKRKEKLREQIGFCSPPHKKKMIYINSLNKEKITKKKNVPRVLYSIIVNYFKEAQEKHKNTTEKNGFQINHHTSCRTNSLQDTRLTFFGKYRIRCTTKGYGRSHYVID